MRLIDLNVNNFPLEILQDMSRVYNNI